MCLNELLQIKQKCLSTSLKDVKLSIWNKLGWTGGYAQQKQNKSRVALCDDTMII